MYVHHTHDAYAGVHRAQRRLWIAWNYCYRQLVLNHWADEGNQIQVLCKTASSLNCWAIISPPQELLFNRCIVEERERQEKCIYQVVCFRRLLSQDLAESIPSRWAHSSSFVLCVSYTDGCDAKALSNRAAGAHGLLDPTLAQLQTLTFSFSRILRESGLSHYPIFLHPACLATLIEGSPDIIFLSCCYAAWWSSLCRMLILIFQQVMHTQAK